MGRRGPTPQPDKLKLHGSRRAPSDADGSKPEVEHDKPQRPDWLTNKAAVYAWNQLCQHLANKNLLSASYQNAMVRYCCSWARWVQLVEQINEVGGVYEVITKTGEKKYYLRPEVKILDQLAAQLLRLEHHFGMTPASRLSSLQPTPKPDPKLRFFRNDDPA